MIVNSLPDIRDKQVALLYCKLQLSTKVLVGCDTIPISLLVYPRCKVIDS